MRIIYEELGGFFRFFLKFLFYMRYLIKILICLYVFADAGKKIILFISIFEFIYI